MESSARRAGIKGHSGSQHDAKLRGHEVARNPTRRRIRRRRPTAMGSFAKAIAQLGNVASARLAAPASAHTSRGILQTSQANKTGLSLLLDQTLKSGHDMKTFGLGTAASLSSVDRYARFTAGMLRVYGTMERSLDASSSPATRPLWTRFGESLRREPSLELDLADVATQELPVTPATQAYCAAIEAAAAADEADGGGRMIGHVYCRYFADLFGGQALGAPTYYALAPAVLPGTPRHYDFGEFGANRRESIEAPTLPLALALPLALTPSPNPSQASRTCS